MKYFSKTDIRDLGKINRLNLINSVTGIKPANLLGTKSKDGQENLAIISSVVHVGSNPALVGFMIRPTGEVPRHTYKNIKETGVFTINHVPYSMAEQAHYTSAKFEREQSEFEACCFTPQYEHDFHAPFVMESQVKIGLKVVEELPIQSNGCLFLIGEVLHLFVADKALSPEGYINLEEIETAGVGGLNTYYSLQKGDRYPYARVKDVPSFQVACP